MLTRRQWLALTGGLLYGCRSAPRLAGPSEPRLASPSAPRLIDPSWNWCALGTSIGAGNYNGGVSYVDKVVAAFPSLFGNTHNICVPGSSCDDRGQVSAAQALYDRSKDVNIASLEFGPNDGLRKSAAAFVADLKRACLALRGTGFTIMVSSMLPCASYDSEAFRTSSRALILADPSFWDYLVDWGNTETTMGGEAAKNDTLLYSDGVHPTDHGYNLMEPQLTAGFVSLLA